MWTVRYFHLVFFGEQMDHQWSPIRRHPTRTKRKASWAHFFGGDLELFSGTNSFESTKAPKFQHRLFFNARLGVLNPEFSKGEGRMIVERCWLDDILRV